LFDADRRTDMERISGLIGFDHAAHWTEICTLNVPAQGFPMFPGLLRQFFDPSFHFEGIIRCPAGVSTALTRLRFCWLLSRAMLSCSMVVQ
jgi:hypothetical protein